MSSAFTDVEVTVAMEGRDDAALLVDLSADVEKLADDARGALGVDAEVALTLSLDGVVLDGTGSLQDLGVGPGHRLDVRVGSRDAARGVLRGRGVDEGSALECLTDALRQGGAEDLLSLIVAAGWEGVVTAAVQRSEAARVDLSRCETMTAIGDEFLKNTPALREVVLPAALEVVGDYLLYGSGVARVNLQGTQLRRVGQDFLTGTAAVEEVELPATVEAVGDYFLSESGVTRVSLARCTRLRRLGDYVMCGTRRLEEMALPESMEEIGESFLFQSGIARLDLSHTHLRDLGECFLAHTRGLEELELPGTLQEIGRYFLRASTLRMSAREALLLGAEAGC